MSDNEPEYEHLPALRRALVSDDPDRRATAYGAVARADLDPSEALSDDPPVQPLVDAGVIPEEDSTGRPDAADQRERIIELLEQIANGGGD